MMIELDRTLERRIEPEHARQVRHRAVVHVRGGPTHTAEHRGPERPPLPGILTDAPADDATIAVRIITVRPGGVERILADEPRPDVATFIPRESVRSRDADVVELAVREQRPGVALPALGPTEEEFEPPPLGCREHVLAVPAPADRLDPVVEPGRSAREGPLVRGEGLAEIRDGPIDGESVVLRHRRPCGLGLGVAVGSGPRRQRGDIDVGRTEDRLVRPTQRGVSEHPPHHRRAITRHLVGVLNRPDRVAPHRVGATVPVEPAVMRRVDERRCVPAGGPDALGKRQPVGESKGRLVTGRATHVAGAGQRGIEEQRPPEFDCTRIVRDPVGRIGRRRRKR
jgi:hypothetical protein